MRGAVGSVAISGCSSSLMLAGSVILARVLGPSGYGVYGFAMAISGLLLLPAQMGLDRLLTREIAANEVVSAWELVAGMLRWAGRTVSLTTSLVAATAWLVLWLAPLHLSRLERSTLALATGLMVVNAFSGLITASLMGLRRIVLAPIPMQIGRPAVFLAGVLALWLVAGGRLDPSTAMAVNVFAAAVMLCVLLVMAASSFHARMPRVRPRYAARRWLASALPFVLMAGMGRINAQTDIVMLGIWATARSVGIYRVAAIGATTVIPLVLGSINRAIGPTIAGLHSRGDRDRLVRVVRVAALAGLVGGVLAMACFGFWGQDLIRVIFGPAYLSAWAPLMILALGQTVSAATGPVGVVLNMTGHERDTFWVLGLSAALNVCLNAALIPRFGILGAATATAISTVTLNILATWRVKRRLSFLPFGFIGLSTTHARFRA